jgi:hypothetical protein
MTGFDKKMLHMSHDSDQGVIFDIEVDVLGSGKWHAHKRLFVQPGTAENYVFPEGFSAHWVRIRTSHDCTATAHFHYR